MTNEDGTNQEGTTTEDQISMEPTHKTTSTASLAAGNVHDGTLSVMQEETATSKVNDNKTESADQQQQQQPTYDLSTLHPPRSSGERFRDALLRFLDLPIMQGLGIVVIALVILDGAFFFFLLVGWHNMCDTPSRTDCDPRNKWYNLAIQGLNILFTYTSTISMPWRCTQLLHIIGKSCPHRDNSEGCGLYGFPNDPDIWYWIPLKRRLGITLILLNNCIMQYANQVTRIVYYSFDKQNKFPGNIWTNVFFVASFACGGIGAGWMFYEMGQVRERYPGKFGPGPIHSAQQAWAKYRKRQQEKQEQQQEELRASEAAERASELEKKRKEHPPREEDEDFVDAESKVFTNRADSVFHPDPTREYRRRSVIGAGEGRSALRMFAM